MVASCAEGRYEAARSRRPIAPASYAIHRSAWKWNSRKSATREAGLRRDYMLKKEEPRDVEEEMQR
jgi:hypothetical protein